MSSEDYLETIMLLDETHDVVRVKDVAQKMGVKRPSVVSAIKSLGKKGLAVHEHYGFIKLTSEGMRIAERVYANHKLLYAFFTQVLGVNHEIADRDACMVEHNISEETRQKLIKFIEFVNKHPDKEAPWLLNFRHYAKTGKVRLCSPMDTADAGKDDNST
ncbi:MAG: metal-dependent transcriptional regulator [Thermodesulfobacteriota bacterium]|nr:metal-dependent transcriptional regulator [Thermodesulfobacteriota bacterium]